MFREEDHPRHPSGSNRGGEFTGKNDVPDYIKKKIEDDNPEQVISSKITEAQQQGKDSFSMYKDAEGNIIPERQKLHDKIINDWLNQGSTTNGIIYQMGGAAANGKSSVVEAGVLEHPKGILVLDVDKFKQQLPEYKYMNKIKDPLAATFTHDESSYMGVVAKRRALDKNFDLVIDGVGNGGIDNIKERVMEYRSYGKKSNADYVTLDTDLSVKLAHERGVKTGRFVPESLVRAKNKDISKLVPQLVDNKVYDKLKLWDNNVENKPRLILSQENGVTTVHDNELYQRFLKKAHGK